MNPEEIISTVMRMPLSPAEQQRLLRSALAGNRWALLIVRLHRWRQQQMDRQPTTLAGRLWARIWRNR